MFYRQNKQRAGNSNKFYWNYLDRNGNLVARCFETYHSTIPYEIYIKNPALAKRANSLEEAELFIKQEIKNA